MTLSNVWDKITDKSISTKDTSDIISSNENLRKIHYYIHKDMKSTQLTESELAELSTIVNILQALYTDGNSPIDDSKYDILQEILVNQGIPRLTGSIEKAFNGYEKVEHKYTTLRGTLSKIYYLSDKEDRTNKSRKYLDEWISSMEARYERITGKSISLNDEDVLLQPKFDGVSCILQSDKKSMTWLTRGDTKTNKASNISHIMNKFDNVYKDSITQGVKFEVMVAEESRTTINSLIDTDPYRNSRQVVTSILNSRIPDFKSDYLVPVPLRFMMDDSDIEYVHPNLIRDYPTLTCKLSDRECIRMYANENKIVKIRKKSYRTDGVVITILNDDVRRVLGRENDINNFEVAYKFAEEVGYSTVKDVEFYVSEFAYITPVLVINPIILKGNMISKISLSNKERFNELGLCYGDQVKVLYDIIPYATIDSKCIRNKHQRLVEFTNNCPSCGATLKLDAVQVKCDNIKCPARLIGKVSNYCDSMRIETLGYNTLELLYNNGLLNDGILSLYKLRSKTHIMEKIPGIGKMKISRILSNIEKTRKLKDYEYFGSIGIPNISTSMTRKLFNEIRFDEFMELFENKNFNELHTRISKIPGMGDVKTQQIIEYLIDNEKSPEMKAIKKEVVSITPSYKSLSNVKGVVSFTGCRPSDELESYLTGKEFIINPKVSNKTTHLVAPDESFSSISVEKANALSIPIIYLNQITDFTMLDKYIL